MIAVGLVQVLILLFALSRAKGLAIMIGPEGVGVIGAVDQLVVTLTQISAFGIPFTAMKFMSAAHSDSEDAFKDSFTAFARLLLIISVSVLTIGFAVTSVAPSVLQIFAGYQDVVLIALLTVPPTMITLLMSHTLAAAQKPKGAALYALAFTGSITIAGLLGVWFGGLPGQYFGVAAAGSIVIVLTMIWLGRSLGLSLWRRNVSIRQQLSIRPKAISTSMTAYFGLVTFACTMLAVRYAVINHMGEAAAGLLQSALSLALSVGSILATLNGLYLAPSLNRNEPIETKFANAVRFSNRIALLMVAGAVPVALFPALTLSLLYTDAFIPAAVALVLCLVWQAMFQLMNVYSQLLIGIDRPIGATLGFAVMAGSTTVLAFLLVGSWGILAAPMALIAGTLAATVSMIVLLVSKAGMPLPLAVLGRFVVVAVAIGMAAFLFDGSRAVPGFAGVMLRIGYAGLAYALVFATFRNDEDINAFLTGTISAFRAPFRRR